MVHKPKLVREAINTIFMSLNMVQSVCTGTAYWNSLRRRANNAAIILITPVVLYGTMAPSMSKLAVARCNSWFYYIELRRMCVSIGEAGRSHFVLVALFLSNALLHTGSVRNVTTAKLHTLQSYSMTKVLLKAWYWCTAAILIKHNWMWAAVVEPL